MTASKPEEQFSSESRPVAERMFQLIQGREDRVGVGNADGSVMSTAVESPLTIDDYEGHIEQEFQLAIYPLGDDGMVQCSCIDLDDKDHRPDEDIAAKVVTVVEFLRNIGLCPTVERSQSGRGFHIWLFFSERISAAFVRAFWKAICRMVGMAIPEIFPKQSKLKPGQVGNCVRLPLSNKSHFVEIDKKGEHKLEPLAALAAAKTVTLGDLVEAAKKGGFEVSEQAESQLDPSGRTPDGLPVRVALLLADSTSYFHKRWTGDTSGMNDTSRSSLVSSLACEMVRQFIPTADIRAALEVWCREHKYEKGLHEERLDRAIESAYSYVSRNYRTVRKPGENIKLY